MNNFLNRVKSIIKVVFISVGFFILSLNFVFAIDEFRAGDLVKTKDNSAVYYYGYDGKRHAFPNEQTFYSWYKNFDRIKIIANKTMESLPLGKNIVIRSGTYLVKFYNSSKIYAVEPLGRLRQILNPQLAKDLYGEGWGHRVAYLPEYLFSDYTVEELLAKKKHPTGVVFKYKGDNSYYLVTNEYSRKISSIAKWENYRFNDKFVIQIDKDNISYIDGYDISGFRASLADTAQTLIEEEINDFVYYIKIDPGTTISPTKFAGSGLTGKYYNGMFSGTPVTVKDSQINFDWDLNAPIQNINNDFSVRWTGQIQIPESGDIDFYIFSDDGVRLFIDNKLVIDNWYDQRANWSTGKINLNNGFHNIKLEYYDSGYHAVVKLAWKDKNNIISSNYLYPEF